MDASGIIDNLKRFVEIWSRKSDLPAQASGLAALDKVIEELRNLNRNTESDFLAIGGKLMEFLRSAEAISEGVNRLTTLISGEHARQASDLIARALERCQQMEMRAAERSRNLEVLRDGATSVQANLSSFRDFLATFRVLSILTRIETERLGGEGAGFGSLAEDVTMLAEGMGSKVESVIEAAVLLRQRVEETFVYLSDVDVLLKDLARVMNGVTTSLHSFSEQQAAASVLSSRLVADSNSASVSIRDAVTSIQFHDITRQQVEHVIEALQQISTARDSDAPTPQESKLTREASAVLTLEASQLGDAQQKFSSSVGRLLQDLDNIAARVRAMSGIGRSLLNASENQQNSFFLEMRECVSAILHASGSFALAETATRIAGGVLGATLEPMQKAAGEIRVIDYQLLRLALNANLQSVHIGTKGDTLSVLSSALHELATKSGERSDINADALNAMTRAVAYLSNAGGATSPDARASADADKVAADTAAEMRSAVGELHSWAESSSRQVSEINSLASRLCDDLSAAQSSFTANFLFDEVITGCRKRLVEMVEKAGWSSDGGEGALNLEEFAGRYTMLAEREVHAAVTGESRTEEARVETALVSAPDAGGDDLGDNVELF